VAGFWISRKRGVRHEGNNKGIDGERERVGAPRKIVRCISCSVKLRLNRLVARNSNNYVLSGTRYREKKGTLLSSDPDFISFVLAIMSQLYVHTCTSIDHLARVVRFPKNRKACGTYIVMIITASHAQWNRVWWYWLPCHITVSACMLLHKSIHSFALTRWSWRWVYCRDRQNAKIGHGNEFNKLYWTHSVILYQKCQTITSVKQLLLLYCCCAVPATIKLVNYYVCNIY